MRRFLPPVVCMGTVIVIMALLFWAVKAASGNESWNARLVSWQWSTGRADMRVAVTNTGTTAALTECFGDLSTQDGTVLGQGSAPVRWEKPGRTELITIPVPFRPGLIKWYSIDCIGE